MGLPVQAGLSELAELRELAQRAGQERAKCRAYPVRIRVGNRERGR